MRVNFNLWAEILQEVTQENQIPWLSSDGIFVLWSSLSKYNLYDLEIFWLHVFSTQTGDKDTCQNRCVFSDWIVTADISAYINENGYTRAKDYTVVCNPRRLTVSFSIYFSIYLTPDQCFFCKLSNHVTFLQIVVPTHFCFESLYMMIFLCKLSYRVCQYLGSCTYYVITDRGVSPNDYSIT